MKKTLEKRYRGTYIVDLEGFLPDEGTEFPFGNGLRDMFEPFIDEDKKDENVEVEIIVRVRDKE